MLMMMMVGSVRTLEKKKKKIRGKKYSSVGPHFVRSHKFGKRHRFGF
jgi:hypothetical protein